MLKNTKQAAEYMGVSKSYMDKARGDGSGPNYVRCGRAIRYRQKDLDNWINERVVGNCCTSGSRTRRTDLDEAIRNLAN